MQSFSDNFLYICKINLKVFEFYNLLNNNYL